MPIPESPESILRLGTRHPHYSRWAGIIQRHFIDQVRSGTAASVVLEWQPPAKRGFVNFVHWLNEELKQSLDINPRHFRIHRRDDTRPFSPTNAVIVGINAIKPTSLKNTFDLAKRRSQHNAKRREDYRINKSCKDTDHEHSL